MAEIDDFDAIAAGAGGCGQIEDVPAVVRLRLATRAAPKERAMATMVKVLVFEWR